MNDENTEYHEPTEKVDTSQYDLYPYNVLPDIASPPPKPRSLQYNLSKPNHSKA